VEYWASGHQLAHRGNPYDAGAILKLERSAGFDLKNPVLIIGNPPPALPVILILGWVSPFTGELLWLLLLLMSLGASVWMIHAMHGRPKNLLYLLGLSFAPALSCLIAGQVSIFVLLGLVLFLRFHLSYPFLAGASLWLCLLKPHLLAPFGVVLLVWIVATRSYRVLAGALCSVALSSAIATMIDPLIWTQYSQMMSEQRMDRLTIPSLCPMLRQYVYPHTLWLQCLPAAIGCAWALVYFLKRRDSWDWIDGSSILLPVSVLVAPYCWFIDQSILIPALLHGAYRTRSRTMVAILALLSAAIELQASRNQEVLHSVFYLWTAPAWLVWYLYAARTSNEQHARDRTPGVGEPLPVSMKIGGSAEFPENRIRETNEV
jgi:hypothetical protein